MRKLLADTSISNNPKILEELKKAGWKTTTAYRQEKGTRCYQFGVLYRFENSSVIEPPNHAFDRFLCCSAFGRTTAFKST